MSAIIEKNSINLIPKFLGYAGLLITISSVVYAIAYGDFSNEGALLTSIPWGIVSLIDLYLGLILISLWAFYREDNKKTGFIWMVLIIALGNMISCLYLLKAAYEADGSIPEFWLGNNNSGASHVV